jgi:hypothetical protein
MIPRPEPRRPRRLGVAEGYGTTEGCAEAQSVQERGVRRVAEVPHASTRAGSRNEDNSRRRLGSGVTPPSR